MKEGLTIIPVSNVREVLRHALVRMPEPMEWDEAAWEVAETKRLAALRAEAVPGPSSSGPVAH